MPDPYVDSIVFESDKYLVRFVRFNDVEELLNVYSDVEALLFFNSDNCDGDNFYYQDTATMQSAVKFWMQAYENRWFVRFSIVDKLTEKIIGTIEAFRRDSNDDLNNVCVLRLDLLSAYEIKECIINIVSLFVDELNELFDSEEVITKIPIYAIERAKAFKELGFIETKRLLIGNDGYAYKDYWAK